MPFLSRQLDVNTIDDNSLAKLVRLSNSFAIKICNSLKNDTNNNLKLICSDESICQSLHCCKFYFTTQNCVNSNSECLHGHSLFENYNKEHNEMILIKRNLKDSNPLDLRNYLYDAYHSKKLKTKQALPNTLIYEPKEINLNRKNYVKKTDSSKSNKSKTKPNQIKVQNRDDKKTETVCQICLKEKMFKRIDCDCIYCFNCYFKFKHTIGTKKCFNLKCNCFFE